MAAFDHESSLVEYPRSDGRSRRAAYRAREIRCIDRDTEQFAQRASNGERELRARPETNVWRKRTVYAHTGTIGQFVVSQESAGKIGRALCVVSRYFKGFSQARRNEQRRCRRCRPDTPEPATQRAPQIEHTKMKTRRCLHVDFALPTVDVHNGGISPGADRTKSASTAIASNSCSPAVLSTMTWSRAISVSMNARGSKCRRVA